MNAMLSKLLALVCSVGDLIFNSASVILLLLLCSLKFGSSQSGDTTVIETSYGRILGKVIQLGLKDLPIVEQFLGIPYGLPPEGSRRYMPTQTVPKWGRNTRDCTKLPPVCIQNFPDLSEPKVALASMPRDRYEYLLHLQEFLIDQREDCLYMNVYRPSIRGSDIAGKLPFLVLIHGESFEWNSGNAYDGSMLSSYGQVIVVTINYRLSSYGFLSSGDSVLAGNRALHDILAALNMLQAIGLDFGGDISRITLLGFGTGAALVNVLMTALPALPGGVPMFKRAVLLGGSSLSKWSTVSNPRQVFYLFAEKAGCDPFAAASGRSFEEVRSPDALLECLNAQSLENITRAQARLPHPTFLSILGPVVDGIFVIRQPRENLKRQANLFQRYDLLLGINKFDAYNLFSDDDIIDGIELNKRERLIRTLVRNHYSFHRTEILDSIMNEYTNWSNPTFQPSNMKEDILLAISDAMFAAPAVETVQLHASTDQPSTSASRTWLYVFAHQTKPDWAAKGTTTNDDLPFILGYYLARPGQLKTAYNVSNLSSARDQLTCEIMMRYISNFVKSADPNTPVMLGEQMVSEINSKVLEKLRSQKWPPFSAEADYYISIGERSRVGSYYRAREVAFWTKLLPKLERSYDQNHVDQEHHFLPHHRDATSYFGEVAPLGNNYFSGPFSPPPPLPPPTLPTEVANLIAADGQTVPGDGVSTTAAPTETFAYTSILSITIVIGCALLVLNVLVFAGVYHQRERTKRLNKHQHANHTQHLQYQSYDASGAFVSSPAGLAQGNHVPPPPPPPLAANAANANIMGDSIMSSNSLVSTTRLTSFSPSAGDQPYLPVSRANQATFSSSHHAEQEPLLTPTSRQPGVISPFCPRHGALRSPTQSTPSQSLQPLEEVRV